LLNTTAKLLASWYTDLPPPRSSAGTGMFRLRFLGRLSVVFCGSGKPSSPTSDGSVREITEFSVTFCGSPARSFQATFTLTRRSGSVLAPARVQVRVKSALVLVTSLPPASAFHDSWPGAVSMLV
jgi:hypothetical protein